MAIAAIHAGQRAAVIDPGYTDMWQHDQEIRGQQQWLQRHGDSNAVEPPELNVSALNYTAGILDNPDIIAIPVFMRPNHWVLGIYTRADRTIRYYNTQWAPMNSLIRRQLLAVVNEFYPNEPAPIVHEVPPTEYNRQADSYNCGPHCLLIWESFLRPARSTLIASLSMQHERLRMLSNLIAAFIDDNQPYVPLHTHDDPYQQISDYINSLPFGGIIARPTRGEAEPEEAGIIIPHWHTAGIEVDPAADEQEHNPSTEESNLPQTDAQAFFTNAELCANQGQMATIIQQLCGVNMAQISAFAESTTAGLPANLLDTYLCMLKQYHKAETAVVRTGYTANYQALSASQRSHDYAYGDTLNAGTVLIPILKHYRPSTRGANETANHYILGLYNTQTGSLFHYDSLGT